MSPEPRLSVVIPALDEEGTLPALLADLAGLCVPHEVVVCDGGSADRTREIARELGARVVVDQPGRGQQLRAGADAARAQLLCFLHADARLGPDAVTTLDRLTLAMPAEACTFRLRIDSGRRVYRVIEVGTNLRTRFLGLPFGDQGLIVGRAAYAAAGGYPPIPLMEDVAIARALSRTPGIRLLDASIRVSARRWERHGPLRRSVLNLALLVRYLLGSDPRRLAEGYRPEGKDE